MVVGESETVKKIGSYIYIPLEPEFDCLVIAFGIGMISRHYSSKLL